MPAFFTQILRKSILTERSNKVNVNFIKLENEKEWKDELLKRNKREKIDIENIFREYDIGFKSKNLEEKYMNLLK